MRSLAEAFEAGDWRRELPVDEARWGVDDGGLLRPRARAAPSVRRAAYEEQGGSRQARREEDPLASPHHDRPFHVAAVAALVERLGPDPLVVELGCGDGRVVGMLSEAGVCRIVALDFHEADVRAALERTDRSRVLGVCASIVDDPPVLAAGAADAVVLSEVAYTLEDPSAGYAAARALLGPGAHALVVNAATGSYYVHALLEGDLAKAARAVAERRYAETLGGETFDVHLFTAERMDAEAAAAGFEVVRRRCVPGEVSLLLHALKRAQMPGEGALELVARVAPAARTGGVIPRAWIDLLRVTDPS